MVCLGNICRSPIAEGVLQSKVNSDLVFVDSAGTAAYHVGSAPDKRSVNIASNYNVNLKNQKIRKFTISDFENFDTIYAMDESNYQNILKLAKNNSHTSKVKLILNEVNPLYNQSVPDPYCGGTQGFEKVYMMLEEACSIIAEKLQNDR
ncbi:MAG: Low molecular weight protein-tyrosine-phosphatase YfkJ [Polaribacter sp. SA4-10]|nr:MAG: Low molecular weight protein-tyrosine-phosphatase YfkJ [Polaribacter sp. SA4-10]